MLSRPQNLDTASLCKLSARLQAHHGSAVSHRAARALQERLCPRGDMAPQWKSAMWQCNTCGWSHPKAHASCEWCANTKKKQQTGGVAQARSSKSASPPTAGGRGWQTYAEVAASAPRASKPKPKAAAAPRGTWIDWSDHPDGADDAASPETEEVAALRAQLFIAVRCLKAHADMDNTDEYVKESRALHAARVTTLQHAITATKPTRQQVEAQLAVHTKTKCVDAAELEHGEAHQQFALARQQLEEATASLAGASDALRVTQD